MVEEGPILNEVKLEIPIYVENGGWVISVQYTILQYMPGNALSQR